ncbi:hypothetical protein AAEX28_11685 [Lentisphaerota bacterium WC36G]|nr:hypothetical protein LJT99_14520 [Lentisphaerae bacterium WC36]
MYQKLNNTQIERINDGAIIPIDERNADYQNYLKWLSEGNTLLDPPTEPQQTIFTKLHIRRAFRALNKENVLDELLASHLEFSKDWADANEIDLNDEITAEALQIINDEDNDLTTAIIIEELTKDLS